MLCYFAKFQLHVNDDDGLCLEFLGGAFAAMTRVLPLAAALALLLCPLISRHINILHSGVHGRLTGMQQASLHRNVRPFGLVAAPSWFLGRFQGLHGSHLYAYFCVAAVGLARFLASVFL